MLQFVFCGAIMKPCKTLTKFVEGGHRFSIYFSEPKRNMICKKCGHEIPENINFCNACGSPVNTPVQSETQINNNNQTNSQNNAEQTNNQNSNQYSKNYANQVTDSNNNFADPGFEEDTSKDKKKSSKKKLTRNILAIGIPLIIAALVFFNWDSIVGFCIKTFGSDTDYFRYVESKTLEDTADSLTSFFSNTNFDPKQAATAKVECSLSDEFIALASKSDSSGDLSESLKWLNDVTLTTDYAFDGNKLQMRLNSDANGSSLLNGDMVADFENGKCYISLPELNDEVFVQEINTGDFSQATALLSDLGEVLPEEEVLNELVEKYLEIALDTIEDVSAEEKDMKIGSVEEECTVLKFTVDSDVLFDMGEAILTEAKDDDEIKEFLKDYSNLIKKYNPEMPDIDIDSEYSKGINEVLDELKEAKKQVKNEKLFVLYDYVVDHRVVGRAIVDPNGDEVFRYLTLHDGDDFAFELVAQNALEIYGSGTNDGDMLSASYNVSFFEPDFENWDYENDEELTYVKEAAFDLSISDLDMDKFEDGYVCGKFKFSLDKELLKKTAPEAALFSPSLEVITDHSENNLKLTLNVFTNDTKLFDISADIDYGKDPNVQIPDGDLNGSSSRWSSNLDLDALEDAFKKANAPDIVIDSVNSLKRSIKS